MNFEVIRKGRFWNMGERLVVKIAHIQLFASKSNTPIELF